MLTNIIKIMEELSRSRIYWLMLIFAAAVLLITALAFQYLLDELPCVLCIQVRLWISLLLVVAIIGYFSENQTIFNIGCHLTVILIAIGLVERSYQLLGTERGFLFSDCGFSLGMPSWFAIDEWLPWLYRIETSCGYTPELIFGITMAEALIVFSSLLLVVSVAITGFTVFHRR